MKKTILSQEELDATERAFREACKQYSMEYYKSNIERIKAYSNWYYQQHRERILAKKRVATRSKPITEQQRIQNKIRYNKYYWRNRSKICAKAREKYKLMKLRSGI